VVPVSNGTVLLDLTCSGQVSVIPHQDSVPIFPGFAPMMKLYGMSRFDPTFLFLLFAASGSATGVPLNTAYPIVKAAMLEFQQNRAKGRGMTLSQEAFEINFDYLQFVYDWIYATNKPPVDNGPDMSSPRKMFQQLFGGNIWQITLPKSCTYQRWISEGHCSADYTGFEELFGLDAVIRGSVKSCGPDKVPAIQVQCLGSACDTVFGHPQKCSTTSQCPSGMICTPLMDEKYKSDDFDGLFLASIIEGSSYYYYNDSTQNPGAGYQYFQKDLDYIANFLSAGKGSGPGLCVVNWTTIVTSSQYGRLYATNGVIEWLQAAVSLFRSSWKVSLNWFSAWFN